MNNVIPVSADGFKLKRGSVIYELHTFNGGKTWYITSKVIHRTNKRGMVSFEDKPVYWHMCKSLIEMVGDHRIYINSDKAVAEMLKRNIRGKI